jgi:hypothetical protein
MAMHFAIAGEMLHRGLNIPFDWDYSPGMADDPREPDSIEFDLCLEASDADLERAGNILHRYEDFLRRHGKDY